MIGRDYHTYYPTTCVVPGELLPVVVVGSLMLIHATLPPVDFVPVRVSRVAGDDSLFGRW